MLGSLGFELALAHSPKEAFEKLATFEADIALVDLRLERDSGIDVVKALGELRPQIICVVMTGYASTDTAVDALRSGAYDFLRKPLILGELESTLNRCSDIQLLRMEKSAVESKLREARDDLEKRVEERTQELTETNEELRRQISERERAEEESRVNEDRLQAIIGNAPVEIYLKDSEGRHVMASARSNDLFGKGASVVGKTAHELFANHEADIHVAHDREVMESRRAIEREYEIAVDGEVRTYLAIKFPVPNTAGNAPLICAISTDITDRKHAEEDLRVAKDQADAASRAKSDFLRSMSHELRTPLNAILGFSQILVLDAEESSDERFRNYVGLILQSGELLLALVNEVLELSAIESGRLSLSIADFPPSAEIRDCLSMAETMAKDRGVRVTESCRDDQLPTIRADRTRFKQVLVNFLTNAVKYNRDGGSVALDCGVTGDGVARFSVIDTGVGIADKHKDKVFEPFERLGTEGGDVEGTGIGLAITKKLVEAMGGRVGFASEPGSGSTFWFELPLA